MCAFNESFRNLEDGTIYKDDKYSHTNFILTHGSDGGYVCQGCYGYADTYAVPEFSDDPDREGFFVCGPVCMDLILREQRHIIDQNQEELIYA